MRIDKMEMWVPPGCVAVAGKDSRRGEEPAVEIIYVVCTTVEGRLILWISLEF